MTEKDKVPVDPAQGKEPAQNRSGSHSESLPKLPVFTTFKPTQKPSEELIEATKPTSEPNELSPEKMTVEPEKNESTRSKESQAKEPSELPQEESNSPATSKQTATPAPSFSFPEVKESPQFQKREKPQAKVISSDDLPVTPKPQAQNVESAFPKIRRRVTLFQKPLSPAVNRIASGERPSFGQPVQQSETIDIGLSNGKNGFYNPMSAGPMSRAEKPKRYKEKTRKKSSLSVRKLFGLLFLLLLIAGAVYAVIVPDTIPRMVEGKLLERVETCTVERMNGTLTFETDCGRFVWDETSVAGKPLDRLEVGRTYNFTVDGIKFLQTYPRVVDYEAT